MIIFIQDVPESTTQEELNKFIRQGFRRFQLFPFLRRKKLKKSNILRIRDLATDKTEYHGLAHIEHEMEGEMLIKYLSGCRLQGKAVTVREYCQRNHRRERRLNPKTEQLAIIDRRRGDRRRQNLQIEALYGTQSDDMTSEKVLFSPEM